MTIDEVLKCGMPVDVLCVGNPEIHGDSVGPTVGSILKSKKFSYDINIIGCVTNPIVVDNYQERILEIREDAFVIVIDSAVGKPGTYEIGYGSIRVGSAVGHNYNSIGNAYIKGYTGRTISGAIRCSAAVATDLSKHIAQMLHDLFYKSYLGVYIGD